MHVAAHRPYQVTFSHGSKNRLTSHDLGRFAGDTLFDRIARVVCRIGLLPRKELFEAWEVARRTRRHCRGGRVVDVAGGHGLLAHIMLLLDDTSIDALIVEPAPPASASRLGEALVAEWPRLDGRVRTVVDDIRHVQIHDSDVLVSSHACGTLTDYVLDAAIAASAPVAVLPCCHDLVACNPGPLTGWMDGPLAIDAMRAIRLAAAGFTVKTQTIPPTITPKNRLLLGIPARRRLLRHSAMQDGDIGAECRQGWHLTTTRRVPSLPRRSPPRR